MIRWTKEYSIGVPEIDKEHQYLFSALNDFYDGIAFGSTREKLVKLIENLMLYTKFHFQHEEELMDSLNYPELEAHKKEHHDFVASVSDFETRLREGTLQASLEVTGFLKDWILNHILHSDKRIELFMHPGR